MTACEALLESSSIPAGREPIWLVVGRARLRLASVLHVLGRSKEARLQLNSASQWLTAASAPGKSNRINLLWQLQELKDSAPLTDAGLFINDSGLLKRYEVFSNDQYVQNDGYIISTALCRGNDVALAILEKDESNLNRDIFWEWCKRKEAVLEELGDIARLYINRLATGDIACTLFGDYGSLINWHHDFNEKYSTFNLWRQRISASKTLVLIYVQIRNADQFLRIVKEIKEIHGSQDKFWQAEGFRPQSEISSHNRANSVNENLLPVAFQPGPVQSGWYLHDSTSLLVKPIVTWDRHRIKIGSDSNDPSIEMETLLLRFMVDDFAIGVLDKNDVKVLCSGLLVDVLSMNDLPSRHGPSARINEIFADSLNLSTILRTLTPETLSTMLYGTIDSPTPNQLWEQMYEKLSKWLLEKSSKPENKRHYLLFQIQLTRHNRTSYPKSSLESQVAEAQRLINLIPRLNATIQDHVSSNIAILKNLIASSKSAIYLQTNGSPLVDTECQEFREILDIYKQSLEEIHGNWRYVSEIQTHVNMAQLYFHAALKHDQRALDPFFQSFFNALAALEKIRDGWRALQGWKRVENLTFALQNRDIMVIIPWAVAVLTKYPDSQTDFRAGMIWSMVQCAKSMGLGWLMEISASEIRDSQVSLKTSGENATSEQDSGRIADSTYPETVDTKGDKSSKAENGEELLESKIGQAESESVYDRELKLEESQDHSTPIPTTKSVAERSTETPGNDDGPYTILKDLETQLQQLSKLGGNTVFVDWYNGTSRLKSFLKPLVVSIAPGQKPKCCIADITWEAIDNVVNRFIHLDSKDLQNKRNSNILYELNPLVEPLKHLSKPGQVLVFLPCGNLHRIPLHALLLNDEVLIRRNPIVYCSSLGALTIAFERRQDKEKRGAITISRQASFSLNASIYGDPPSDIGKKALHATASKLGVSQLHTNEQFDPTLFIQTIQDPSLQILHYHGHANFSTADPMDQNLSFGDQSLTLREIFDIKAGDRAFHATLLGCGSGASKTVQTNDVIGLVPAFFHAGAASTVSSLWTFSDRDAALYQKYFYNDLAGFGDQDEEVLERKLGGIGVEEETTEDGRVDNESFAWNLALANQRAVLSIMEQKPELYHWAGFVLNGWWMMRVPRGNVSKN